MMSGISRGAGGLGRDFRTGLHALRLTSRAVGWRVALRLTFRAVARHVAYGLPGTRFLRRITRDHAASPALLLRLARRRRRSPERLAALFRDRATPEPMAGRSGCGPAGIRSRLTV